MSDTLAVIAAFALMIFWFLIQAAFLAGTVLLGFWVLDAVGIL